MSQFKAGSFALLILLCLSLVSAASVAAQSGVNVTGYGAKCDGITDDTAAITNAIAAAASKCRLGNFLAFGQNYISLPSGATCKINGGLTFDTACVGLEGNGSLLDASAISNGAAITLITSEPYNPYSANTARYAHFLLNGGGSNRSTVGIQIDAGGIYLGPVDIAHFGAGIQFGNYAYADRIEGTDVGDTKVGLNCPGGSTDAGEQIVFSELSEAP